MTGKRLPFKGGIWIAVVLLTACSPYTQQVVPFKMPSAFSNMTQVAGIQIGAMAFTDPNQAQNAFGFDIRGAGLLPVQVVINHQGAYPIEINPAQTFLVDHQNNFWPVLDKRLAYERVARYTEMAQVGAGAVKHGFLGATAGALIGAAIGIVTGRHVGESAAKGAAVGDAAGATTGGASAYGSASANQVVAEDLRNKSLESRPIRPMEVAHGFIFFPGEAPSGKELRLQLREVDTGRFLNLVLPF